MSTPRARRPIVRTSQRPLGGTPDGCQRPSGRRRPRGDRLHRGVQLGRLGDLDADHERGRPAAGLALEFVHGLTRSLPHVTDPGEPEKYVPLLRRTYGRIAVTDVREADALAEYLVVLGVRRAVLVDDAELYGSGLAHLLQQRLPGVGATRPRLTARPPDVQIAA